MALGSEQLVSPERQLRLLHSVGDSPAVGSVEELGLHFLDLVSLTERLLRCRWVLGRVVTLAQQAPELSAEQLRAVLVELAAAAATAGGLGGPQ